MCTARYLVAWVIITSYALNIMCNEWTMVLLCKFYKLTYQRTRWNNLLIREVTFFFSKCYTIFFLEIRNITLSFSQDGVDHTCMLYTMLYCLAHLFCHLNYKIPFVIQNVCAQWENEPDAIFKHESKMKIEFWCCYHNYCLTVRTMIKKQYKKQIIFRLIYLLRHLLFSIT